MNRNLNFHYFKSIIVLLLISFSGCVSSRFEYVEENKLPTKKTFNIIEIYMNDGRVITVKDMNAKLKLKYNGEDDFIVYGESGNETLIKLTDIDRLKIEIFNNSSIAITIVSVVLIIIIVILALGILIGPDGFTMH